MNENEPYPRSPEIIEPIVIIPPGQALLSPEQPSSAWPQEILMNTELQKTALERRELLASFDSLHQNIGSCTINVRQAFEHNVIGEDELIALYSQLSHFLEQPWSERLILYFPFELIPDGEWKPGSEPLSSTLESFRKVYLDKWQHLLSIHDVRANFVDGDIVETELRKTDLPRVVKVAHLIPVLVEKKLMTIDDILALLERTDDPVLQDSIIDALPVLKDNGLLGSEDIARMMSSENPLIRNAAIIIESAATNEGSAQEENIIVDATWLSSLEQKIAHDHEKTASARSERVAPEGRIKWEATREEELIVERLSDDLSRGMIAGTVTTKDISSLVPLASEKACLVLLTGMRKCLEAQPEKQQEIMALFKTIDERSDAAITDAIRSALSHLALAKVIDQGTLDEYKVKIPAFDADISADSEDLSTPLQQVLSKIESHQELSDKILPVAILYGSKVKGYAKRSADDDIAVFIKPGTSIGEANKIREALGDTVLIWLEEKEGVFDIKELPDNLLSKKEDITYMLFCGIWSGKEEAVKELHEKLLVQYLFSDSETERRRWLEELERQSIQYRLMHKGYARFYPATGGMSTPHSDSIDSNSMFWDSGFRTLATKLFLKKVFLPKLSKDLK